MLIMLLSVENRNFCKADCIDIVLYRHSRYFFTKWRVLARSPTVPTSQTKASAWPFYIIKTIIGFRKSKTKLRFYWTSEASQNDSFKRRKSRNGLLLDKKNQYL